MLKRLAIALGIVLITAFATAAIYPAFVTVRVYSPRRSKPAQWGKIHKLDALRIKGHRAVEKGDYVAAETAFRSIIRSYSYSPEAIIDLARLYDIQGRDQNALGVYEIILDTSKGNSDYQRDPRVLARYGDLLLKFERSGNAEKAYVAAIQAGDPSGVRTPPNVDLATLRSIAHTMASERYRREGDVKAADRELVLSSTFPSKL